MTIVLSIPNLIFLTIGIVMAFALVVAVITDYHQTQREQSQYFPVIVAHRTITVVFLITCFVCVMLGRCTVGPS